ncbi:MAG TPA: hypothetical protein P5332_10820 [Ignavibacteriales bacterium]|nr:hypothetical protein [Ignavibacteriales bacterium]
MDTQISDDKQEELTFIVDGKKVSLLEFQTLLKDPKIKLIELSKHNFKTLERLYG